MIPQKFIEDLLSGKDKLSVVGLGYVGLPVAYEFAKHLKVVGFDTNAEKISLYRQGLDPTHEVGNERLRQSSICFTSEPNDLRDAKFHIVAVPTPISADKRPDLSPVESASRLLGKHLTAGSVVVFESTVYPGVTQDICIPILEEESGLRCGRDFRVGYSPERINPGDTTHTLRTIKKIVSGQDAETLKVIRAVYDLVVDAGTHAVSSIKTAEAIKVVENAQRDINIAFMNELAMVFDRMGIDSNEVVDGMNTKWNALGFRPGLVGGHCIGVDPYYFTYEAEKLGYHSQIILAGRKVNDGMGEFVADAAIKELILSGFAPASANVFVYGLTFKENCPDIRNTRVMDVVSRLREFGISPKVVDPQADPVEAKRQYDIDLVSLDDVSNADCIILAVSHDEFRALDRASLDSSFSTDPNRQPVLIDVKGLVDSEELDGELFRVWRL